MCEPRFFREIYFLFFATFLVLRAGAFLAAFFFAGAFLAAFFFAGAFLAAFFAAGFGAAFTSGFGAGPSLRSPAMISLSAFAGRKRAFFEALI
jgi:hypothetical protein